MGKKKKTDIEAGEICVAAAGVINRSIRKGDYETAAEDAATAGYTLMEVDEFVKATGAEWDAETALLLIRAELIKEAEIFNVLAVDLMNYGK